MIPTGDTWGISGPTFLLAYLVLAVAVGVAVLRTRRALADVSADRPVSRMEERPYDVAYLNGGAPLAVTAALSAMYRAGTISTAGRGVVVAGQRPESRADELERAIHHAAGTGPVSRHTLATVGAVASALHRVEQRLIGGGLLLAAERRQGIRLAGGWVLVVAVFGAVRIMAGFANNRPVGFLTVLVVLVAALGVLLVCRAPRRTRAGDAALSRLATEYHSLSPSMRPDWAHYGPAGAAVPRGGFGGGAPWEGGPGLPPRLGPPRAVRGVGAPPGGGPGGGGSRAGRSWRGGG